MVAQRENTTLRYMHQDHLSGTSLMTDTGGNSLGTMKYYPYGSTRSGSVPTDELFTGQKLDGTGLYYYGARYYDPMIGRFISPDTVIPDPLSSQGWNRYSYCLNNPLKYNDPSGHIVNIANTMQYSYSSDGNRVQTRFRDPVTYEEASLIDAWNLFKDTCPDIAQMLEESNETITIGYGDTAFDGGTLDLDITINAAQFDEGIAFLTELVAHEVVHVTVNLLLGSTADTMYEEIVAYQYQNRVAGKIGARSQWLDIINPVRTYFPCENTQLDKQLAKAQATFREREVDEYNTLKTLAKPSVYDTLRQNFVIPSYEEQMMNYWYGVW